jgi:hypothetical protein
MLCVVLLLAACNKSDNGGGAETGTGDYTLTVQPADLQEVKGWGVFPGYTDPPGTEGWGDAGFHYGTSINTATEARRVIFEELGINIFRCWFNSTTGENYTAEHRTLRTDYLDELATLIKYAESKGVTDYLITLWSPPYHMKEMAAGVGGGYRARLKHENYDLFVSYIVDALKYLRDTKGCPLPTAFSFANEPTATPTFSDANLIHLRDNLCYYTGPEYVNLLTKLRTALNAGGMSAVKLGAFEEANYVGQYLYSPYRELGAAQFVNVDIHVIHSYSNINDYYSTDAQRVVSPLIDFRRIKAINGHESWQTEVCAIAFDDAGANLMTRLTYIMRTLASDMIWAEHSVWMWWLGWTTTGVTENMHNFHQHLLHGEGISSVEKNAIFNALATIFKSVPPGSHVRKVASNDPALKITQHIQNDLVAFQTPDGTFVLLVNGADRQKTYDVSGLDGAAGTHYTITGDDAKNVQTSPFAVSGGKAQVAVPANSVNFIITK